MPSRHMVSGLDAEELEAGEWDLILAYRYIHSTDFFVGSKEVDSDTDPRLKLHSLDVAVHYAITRRWSASLIVPILDSRSSSIHLDGNRHSISTGAQVGDLRLLANYWAFDPEEEENGNLGFSLGVKVPTGNEELTGSFVTPTGRQRAVLDISQQPGDGGWGAIVEALFFKEIFDGVSIYGSGSYLINPRNTNDTEALQSLVDPTRTFNNSVPDQYSARLGVGTVVLPGLSFGLGGRVEGIPVHDLIGDSDGFRRPGRSIFVEPSVDWRPMIGDRQLGTFTASVPYAVDRRLFTSDLDRSRGVETSGDLAGLQIHLAFTMTF